MCVYPQPEALKMSRRAPLQQRHLVSGDGSNLMEMGCPTDQRVEVELNGETVPASRD